MFIDKTSAIPSIIRAASNKYTLALASQGVTTVKAAVMAIPVPKIIFPPYFLAKYPPNSCVVI